ncbi:MAG TPA: glycosyltransferase [Bacteroidia bacterium]|nr:glycosyltransferase [Bacteroidia bacterium]
MKEDKLNEEDHKARSRFIRKLIQNPNISHTDSSVYVKKIPLQIVQFWDRLDSLPNDVKDCMQTWANLSQQGIERLFFDNQSAKDFILKNLGVRHLAAFNKCYHPAMQADYFRLCYILIEGGCYIDSDDVYNGGEIKSLFNDGRLKIQPLCYDIISNTMIPPNIFTKSGTDALSWIFYFNNNPLIACSGHPVVKRALIQATLLLENEETNGLQEIQSTTGPGNLSKTIFDTVAENAEMEHTLLVLSNWEDVAKCKWELSYRNDARNWRHSNCLRFKE